MSDSSIKSSHIRNIDNTNREIRERHLLSLISKLKCGIDFDDAPARRKELVIYLLKWLKQDNPNYQEDVLELLLMILNSPSGKDVIDSIGCEKIQNDLDCLRSKIFPRNRELLNSIIKCVHTFRRTERIEIPQLDMPMSEKSDVDHSYSKRVDLLRKNILTNPQCPLNDQDLHDLSKRGLKIYLMPWCRLSKSDNKKIEYIEECIERNESEHAIYFFTNVLLKDFPAEVFLNRPNIINRLRKMISDEKLTTVSLEALEDFCSKVYNRIQILCNPQLKNCKKFLKPDDHCDINSEYNDEESVFILKQSPLPIFCLDTLYMIINNIRQNYCETTSNILSLKEVNLTMSLSFNLLHILKQCLTIHNWSSQCHQLITEIMQKLIIFFRICAELLNKLRASCLFTNTIESSSRVIYIRLLILCTSLMDWCQESKIVPSNFVSSLYNSLFDVSFSISYSKAHETLDKILQNYYSGSNNSEDKNKMKLYLDIKNVCLSMSYVIRLLEEHKSLVKSPNVMNLIKESMASINYHKNEKVILLILDIFSIKILKWSLTDDIWKQVRNICVELFAHKCDWVQSIFYSGVKSIVENVLGGMIKTKDNLYTELSIQFLFDENILKEICGYGIVSKNDRVNSSAKEIVLYLLRGKLLMSDSSWSTLLTVLLPILPLLHIHASYDTEFGRSIIKTLDIKISECMMIPKVDLIMGNIRLLFSKKFSAQMEGAKSLLKILNLQDDADNFLPKQQSLVPEVLCSSLKTVVIKNFNINKLSDPDYYEEGALIQVMKLLNANFEQIINDAYSSKKIVSDVDPSICKSALTQLAVILQQPNLHEIFVKKFGHELILHYFRSSLTVNEFTTFPESAMNCVSILNSLCFYNTTIRLWASEQHNLYLYILRALLLFPNETNFVTMASQLLSLLVFSHFIISNINTSEKSENVALSIHYMIVSETNLPFKCDSHSLLSPFTKDVNEEWIMKQPLMSRYLRIHWCVAWYKGFKNIVKWPYVPESHCKEDFSKSLMLTDSDLELMKATCPIQSCCTALYNIQNATSHKSANKALDILTAYFNLTNECENTINFNELPWDKTLGRFLLTSPASLNDYELLLNLIKFIVVYLHINRNVNISSLECIQWVIEPVLKCSNAIMIPIQNMEDLENLAGSLTTKLKQQIFQLLSLCSIFTYPLKDDFNWNNIINILVNQLTNLHINNITSLACADQIITCLARITLSQCNDLLEYNEITKNLIKCLVYLCNTLYSKKSCMDYKGFSLLFNSLITLSHLLDIELKGGINVNCLDILVGNGKDNVLSVCLSQANSPHVALRSVALKLLSGLCFIESLILYLENESKDMIHNLLKIGCNCLSDLNEASFVREQASVLICNLLASKYLIDDNVGNEDDTDNTYKFFSSTYHENIVQTLTKVCINEDDEFYAGENISLNYLSKREKYEVAFSKSKITIPVKYEAIHPRCTINLLIGISNVLYNTLIVYQVDETKDFFNPATFKMLFRCLLLKIPVLEVKLQMSASICRTLYKASNISKNVHRILVNTRDCVNSLFELFTLSYESVYVDSIHMKEMWKWGFFLIGSFLETEYGYKCIWSILSEMGISNFLYCIVKSISKNFYKDIIDSSLYCFVNVLSGYTTFDIDTHDIHLINILDESAKNSYNDTDDSGKIVTGANICYYLLMIFKSNNQFSINARVKEKSFNSIASCLCNLLGMSHTARMLALNDKFLQELINNLNEIQYELVTCPNQAELIKNKRKSPVLHYFNWIVLLICNTISNCTPAKEIGVEYNVIVPINKLWPWILSDNLLKFHTIHMLCSYTNCNAKACQSICLTIGTRSLLSEIIDLVVKEMNLITKNHSLVILSGCLQILQNVCMHTHCRTIILKSEILPCLNKLHPAITKRQTQWRKVEMLWEQFINVLTRYPEGQLKVMDYMGNLCALIHQADGLMLSCLRNCAFNSYNRPRFLGSAEINLLFSNILLSNGSISQKMDVCATLWVLCANSQKSKSAVKTSGLVVKLMDCLQRLKDSPIDNEREIQIMTYVLNIINGT